MLFHTDLSVIALIGVVLLIGIVKKNAIMMIDFALAAEREQGKRPAEAIFQACLLRFRPIMMTTMAAMFGALPLVRGDGDWLGTPPSAGHRHRWGIAGRARFSRFTPHRWFTSQIDRLRLRWEAWRRGPMAASPQPALG